MRTHDQYAGPRRWAYVALIFFACVIAYYLWVRVDPFSWGRRRPAATRPRPVAVEPPPGGDTSMPTVPVRMKVKRIEKRKYRREELTPPPATMER
ncbi:MAG: hypothetical protein HYZ75_00490 [Elusimicrobia bacterium]|nr:hypothetical protein [Elusimicrobiota bacterium]